MDVESKLSMSLDDLIKKNRPAAGKKPIVKKGGKAVAKKTVGGKTQFKSRPGRASVKKPAHGVKKAINKGDRMDVDNEADNKKKFARKVVIKSAKENAGSRTVTIKNIPYDLDWKDVKGAFSRVGKIERVEVTKGQAIITFSDPKDANKAVQTYNGGDMNGRTIKAYLGQ